MFRKSLVKDFGETYVSRLESNYKNAFGAELKQIPPGGPGADFIGGMARAFEREYGDILGSRVARNLGEDYGKAFVDGWTRRDLAAIKNELNHILTPFSKELGDDMVGALSRNVPDTVLNSLRKDLGGNLPYKFAGMGASAVSGGINMTLTMGFYNLIFGPEHKFETGAAAFGAGALMGIIGHGGRTFVIEPIKNGKNFANMPMPDSFTGIRGGDGGPPRIPTVEVRASAGVNGGGPRPTPDPVTPERPTTSSPDRNLNDNNDFAPINEKSIDGGTINPFDKAPVFSKEADFGLSFTEKPSNVDAFAPGGGGPPRPEPTTRFDRPRTSSEPSTFDTRYLDLDNDNAPLLGGNISGRDRVDIDLPEFREAFDGPDFQLDQSPPPPITARDFTGGPVTDRPIVTEGGGVRPEADLPSGSPISPDSNSPIPDRGNNVTGNGDSSPDGPNVNDRPDLIDVSDGPAEAPIVPPADSPFVTPHSEPSTNRTPQDRPDRRDANVEYSAIRDARLTQAEAKLVAEDSFAIEIRDVRAQFDRAANSYELTHDTVASEKTHEALWTRIESDLHAQYFDALNDAGGTLPPEWRSSTWKDIVDTRINELPDQFTSAALEDAAVGRFRGDFDHALDLPELFGNRGPESRGEITTEAGGTIDRDGNPVAAGGTPTPRDLAWNKAETNYRNAFQDAAKNSADNPTEFKRALDNGTLDVPTNLRDRLVSDIRDGMARDQENLELSKYLDTVFDQTVNETNGHFGNSPRDPARDALFGLNGPDGAPEAPPRTTNYRDLSDKAMADLRQEFTTPPADWRSNEAFLSTSDPVRVAQLKDEFAIRLIAEDQVTRIYDTWSKDPSRQIGPEPTRLTPEALDRVRTVAVERLRDLAAKNWDRPGDFEAEVIRQQPRRLEEPGSTDPFEVRLQEQRSWQERMPDVERRLTELEQKLRSSLEDERGMQLALETAAKEWHGLRGDEFSGYVIPDATMERLGQDYRRDAAFDYSNLWTRDLNVSRWLNQEKTGGDVFGDALYSIETRPDHPEGGGWAPPPRADFPSRAEADSDGLNGLPVRTESGDVDGQVFEPRPDSEDLITFPDEPVTERPPVPERTPDLINLQDEPVIVGQERIGDVQLTMDRPAPVDVQSEAPRVETQVHEYQPPPLRTRAEMLTDPRPQAVHDLQAKTDAWAQQASRPTWSSRPGSRSCRPSSSGPNCTRTASRTPGRPWPRRTALDYQSMLKTQPEQWLSVAQQRSTWIDHVSQNFRQTVDQTTLTPESRPEFDAVTHALLQTAATHFSAAVKPPTLLNGPEVSPAALRRAETACSTVSGTGSCSGPRPKGSWRRRHRCAGTR